MAPLEPSDPTTTKPEHFNADEAEENDLKSNFMKMTEAVKEEIKNSLKNWRKDKQKNGKKSINQEKKSRKNKQVKETAQDLKIEIEAIKKTKTKGILKMENWAKWTVNTDVTITNRVQEMEERISSVESMIEEIDS